MPFKSDAQRKYMNWAASKGKIKQTTVDEFNDASKGKELPDYAVEPKKSKFPALQKSWKTKS